MIRSTRPLRLLLAISYLLITFAFGQGSQPTYIQLILDASGSMFNKLEDGRYRIVAAKDVLTQLISSLPDDQGLNVGLRVYGTGRWASDPDACEDTHLLVPMEGLERGQLLQTVRDTQAQGATPIALSLELAAQDFPAEGRKVIVLITDGIESCRTDLREVAESLRAQGFDIDLRIIGIDLDDFARAAFDGLGTFENATSATELLAALNRAVEVAPAEVRHQVTVNLTREGAPATEGGLVEFVGSVDQQSYAFPASDDGAFTSELPAGAYTAIVRDAFSAEPTTVTGLTVTEGVNEFAFELAPPVEVTLTVSDEAPPAGSDVTVTFEGAPAGRGQVWMSPQDADVALDWEYVTGPAGDVVLRLPDEPGPYRVVYHVELPEGGTKAIGSVSLEVQPVTASVTVAAEAVAGSDVEAVWNGPDNSGDYLTIVPAGAPEGTWQSFEYTREGSPLSLRVPDQPGDYEVRYLTARTNSTLASAPLVVTAATASVTAPQEAVAGSDFEVTWQGPDNSRDYLTVVPAGSPEGTYESFEYTTSGSPLTLRAAGEPGDYEVRYVTGGVGATLASAPIRVTAASATIGAPASAVAGSDVEVTFDGPDNSGDYVTIVPAGSPDGTYFDYEYTYNGSPASLRAPEEQGEYEVRYVAGVDSRTLASAPLSIEAATATLEAPATVAPGEQVTITWTGPDNSRDYITIVPAGSPAGTYQDYEYTTAGSPVSMAAPAAPGEYEIRYVTGGQGYTLASVPLTVR